MAYKIEFLPYAVKQLAKLDKTAQRRIVTYLENRVAEDPRSHGKGLTGDLAGCWRYRIGDYYSERVVRPVNAGLADSAAGRVIPHDQVMDKISAPIEKHAHRCLVVGRQPAPNLVCFPQPVQFPNQESNPCPSSRSRGWLGSILTVGSRAGEPPNRQGAALFNQGNDSLNHRIASKAVSRVGLELASDWWQ